VALALTFHYLFASPGIYFMGQTLFTTRKRQFLQSTHPITNKCCIESSILGAKLDISFNFLHAYPNMNSGQA